MSQSDKDIYEHLKVTKCPSKAKFRYAFYELETNEEFMKNIRSFTNLSLEDLFEKGFYCLLDVSTIGFKKHEWLRENQITENVVKDLVAIGGIVDLLAKSSRAAFNKINIKQTPNNEYLN